MDLRMVLRGTHSPFFASYATHGRFRSKRNSQLSTQDSGDSRNRIAYFGYSVSASSARMIFALPTDPSTEPTRKTSMIAAVASRTAHAHRKLFRPTFSAVVSVWNTAPFTSVP